MKKAFELPKSISSLAEELQIIQISWQGVSVQIPKFAVYSILERPVFDSIAHKNGRNIGMLNFGRYTIPILDPFRGDIELNPNYAVVISHCRGNLFGLYGYPADFVDPDVHISSYHGSVSRIVRDYV
jgi:hypothetical protein